MEKQLHSLADTNSSILRHMETLEGEMQKKDISVDIWGNASRFYHAIDVVKDDMTPKIVALLFLYNLE